MLWYPSSGDNHETTLDRVTSIPSQCYGAADNLLLVASEVLEVTWVSCDLKRCYYVTKMQASKPHSVACETIYSL